MRCLEKDDVDKVLAELHDGPAGGNFGGEMTTHTVLRVEYYWPTLFKYAHAYARKCQVFQVNMSRERILAKNPFEQWGLDVVGEIGSNS